MAKHYCVPIIPDIDKELAKRLGDKLFTPSRVATLRGMYEAGTGKLLDLTNLDDTAKKLAEYRNILAKRNPSSELKYVGAGNTEAIRHLYRSMSSPKINDRVNMISQLFSLAVNNIQKKNPSISREDIVNGWIVDGIIQYGEFNIFETVYSRISSMREAYLGKDNELYDEFTKILNNWPALITLVRAQLKDTEGLKLGNSVNYGTLADESNYDSEDLSDIIDPTESKKESYQEIKDRQSPIGRISQQVRRFLSSVYQYEVSEDGKSRIARDDLGIPKTLDPVRVHETLSEMFLYMNSEEQMMQCFLRRDPATGSYTDKLKYEWMRPIYTALSNDSKLRTMFWVDFKKNQQLYSTVQEDTDKSTDGIKHYSAKILNKPRNLLEGDFNMRIRMGTVVADNSIYDSKGNINWQKLRAFRLLVKEWLEVPEEKSSSNSSGLLGKTKVYGSGSPKSKFFTPGITKSGQDEFLRLASAALGIRLSQDEIDAISSNRKRITTYTKNLLGAVNAIDRVLGNSTIKVIESGDFSSLKSLSYQALLDAVRDKGKVGDLKGRINNLLTVISASGMGTTYESRARYIDKKGKSATYFSHVQPSYLGDRLERIKYYVINNDKEGLKQFITDNYLKSSFFKDSENILNKWLDELIKCCDSKDHLMDTFASQFTFDKFLGSKDVIFENFPEKVHALTLIKKYFADIEQGLNEGTTASYPIFILGDSGVQKFIRAKRYNIIDFKTNKYNSAEFQKILSGYKDVFHQEMRRMALQKAANSKLAKDGYKPITNFSKSEGFSTLVFLNENYRASDGTIGKYAKILGNPTEASEEAVINAITAFMKDSIVDFKKHIENLGLLETKEVVDKGKKVLKYVYLDQEATPDNIDAVLTDYYWNTKFALIQQFQFLSIDPSFFSGSKEAQKRFKGTHSPGNKLSISAKDPDGNFYSGDSEGTRAIESCVYIDDITTNTESTDPAFMEVVAYHEGKKKAPAGASREEILRIGRESHTYKEYKEVSLTDGQAWRTLRSYMKMMHMYGKVSGAMEDAFEKIESIRAKIREENRDITEEEIEEISKLSVHFQPTKPMMFTHEFYPINDEDQLIIPVYHKYAEVVIIPELYPANSRMRDLAYWMDEHKDENGKSAPIDLVLATTAVKTGNFGSVDISQVSNSEDLNAVMSKGYVHQLSYEDYRIQTNLPEHTHSSALYGTQSRKISMANVRLDADYSRYVNGRKVNLGGRHGMVKLTGKNLIAFYNSLIIANIRSSLKKFAELVKNPKSISNLLIDNNIHNDREPIDDIFAYSIEKDNKFMIPLFEGRLVYNATAFLLSFYKKLVNKQSILGGSAVQASALGIKGYDEDDSLKIVTNEDRTNLLYVECEIPFDFSYIDENGNKVSLRYTDYVNPDRTLKMSPDGETSLLEYRFPGITDIIAYRIPTEGAYSMLNLKAVRFSNPIEGGVIKVPAQCTKISGFDFDADKLYFMRKEFRAKRKQSNDEAIDDLLSAIFEQDTSALIDFEEYDFDKTPYENSRTARNNMLIDLLRERLMDEETLDDRVTPGNFDKPKRAARSIRELLYGNILEIRKRINSSNITDAASLLDKIANDENREDPEPKYDISDPITILKYNEQNQVSGKLIGIYADHNAHQALCSLMSEFKLKAPIAFAGHSYGDGTFSDFMHSPKGVDVYRNVKEYLDAAVDAVKDPVLNDLNINTITGYAGEVLARIGYTATEIGLLFNQPIIKELCIYCLNNGVGIDKGILEISNKYKNYGVWPATVPIGPSSKTLIDNIIDDRMAKESGDSEYITKHATEQLNILKLFEEIASISSEVSQFVRATGFTKSNAVHSTIGGMYNQQMAAEKYIKEVNTKESKLILKVTNTISNPVNTDVILKSLSDSEYIDALIDNPFGYEQAMYDSNRIAIDLLNKVLFPYETSAYRQIRDLASKLVVSGIPSTDLIDMLHSECLVYLLSQQEFSYFNGNLPKDDTGHGDISTREYYTKYFAEDLYRELEANPKMKDMPIFEHIAFTTTVKEGDASEEIGLVVYNIGGLNNKTIDRLMQSWAELARIKPLIARDLYLYNFYKLGYRYGQNSFMSLAPVEVMELLEVPSVSPRTDILLDENGLPIVMYGGYSTNTNRKATDLGDTVDGNIPDYINPAFGTGYYFTTKDASIDHANMRVKEHIKKGEKGYTPQVSKFHLSKDAKVKRYKDIEEANKHTDEWSSIDVIILDNNGNFEVIVKGQAKDKVIFADRERTYREFLYEIKEDNLKSLPDSGNDFARQFILNHTDNKELVFQAKIDRVKKVLEPLIRPNEERTSSFILDLANISDIKLQNQFIIEADREFGLWRFVPAILFDGGIYIANGSGGKAFNESSTPSIEYVRMQKLGVTGKSLQYHIYLGDSVPSNDIEDNSTKGNSSQDPGPISSNKVTDENKTDLLNEVKEKIDLGQKAGIFSEEGARLIIDFISTNAESKLDNIIDNAKRDVRENGLIVKDENGEDKKSC